MKKFLEQNKLGIVFDSNRNFIDVLTYGQTYNDRKFILEVVDMDSPINTHTTSVLNYADKAPYFYHASVSETGYGILYVDGHFQDFLLPGEYVYYEGHRKHEVKLVDTSEPKITQKYPKNIIDSATYKGLIETFDIKNGFAGIVFYDNKFQEVLEPGVYSYWRTSTDVTVNTIPTLNQKVEVSGQEILTKDKVGVRVNFVTYLHIVDPKQACLTVNDPMNSYYVMVQLALRSYISSITIDELLENREKLEKDVLADISKKAEAFFIKVDSVGVKDIILPGDYREIMNTVLLAEKKAQANVIARREEVASTRSLLNTAKLLEDNEILRRLKEYEYIERISENVSSFNVTTNGNVLEDLSNLVNKKSK